MGNMSVYSSFQYVSVFKLSEGNVVGQWQTVVILMDSRLLPWLVYSPPCCRPPAKIRGFIGLDIIHPKHGGLENYGHKNVNRALCSLLLYKRKVVRVVVNNCLKLIATSFGFVYCPLANKKK